MTMVKKSILLWMPGAEFVEKYIITNAFHPLDNQYCLWYLMDENTAAEYGGVFPEKKCIMHAFKEKEYASRKLLASLFRFRAAHFTYSYFFRFYNPDGTLRRKFPLYEILGTHQISSFVLKAIHRYIPIDFFRILSRKSVYDRLTRWVETVIPLSRQLKRQIKRISPAYIIIPTATFTSKQIDILRAGKRSNSKIVVMPVGWDNITTKLPLYIKPDLLLERGPQNADHAKQIFDLKESEIGIVGVYAYDNFFSFQKRKDCRERKADYRKKLNIPQHKMVILFAGAMRAFDEITFLELLKKAIIEGALPNAHIIYRPHPSRWAPISKDRAFIQHYAKAVNLSHAGAEPITLDEDFTEFVKSGMAVGRLPDRSVFNDLYNCIDAIISLPTSVMVEAALFGKPVLGLACDDGKTVGEYSAPVMMKREYFKYFRTLDWYTQCDDKNTFIKDCKRLLSITKMPGIRDRIKKDMEYIVYNDERHFSERISDCLDRC
jgi:hypothetical protein